MEQDAVGVAAPAILPPVHIPPETTPASIPEITAPPRAARPPIDQPVHLDKLALHLDEDCWIEIQDGRGRQLYYKVGRAGKTYEFQGARPFRVTLGHARGVTVVYNGEPFDHTPYIRRERAKFSLGN